MTDRIDAIAAEFGTFTNAECRRVDRPGFQFDVFKGGAFKGWVRVCAVNAKSTDADVWRLSVDAMKHWNGMTAFHVVGFKDRIGWVNVAAYRGIGKSPTGEGLMFVYPIDRFRWLDRSKKK